MYVIGLTGGSGSGKGYCAELFEKHGIYSLDTDAVARYVCGEDTPCIGELRAAFGDEIINGDGTLNRPNLARKVFTDGKKRMLLNSITHKYILSECDKWAKERERSGDFAAIIDAPLLYESRYNYRCDYCVAVVADEDERIRRIIERDGLSYDDAVARISAQHDNHYFRNRADFLIYNNPGDHPDLQIDLIIQQIRFV